MKMAALLTLLLTALLGAQSVMAAGDPFTGYANTNSYFLEYAGGTSFAPGNSSDVKIAATIAGKSHTFNVDTGSRGLYASSTELGTNFIIGPGSYAGQIQLDSSGRVSSGYWVPTSVKFHVKDGQGNPTTVDASFNILSVETLSAQSGRVATFGVDTSVPGYNGTVNLVGGGTVPVLLESGSYVVKLTNNGVVDQQVSYSSNLPGLIKPVSNFGIGFDLNGAGGGTGPVGNNMNQIYNPLINLDAMRDGTLVSGYVIRTNGIQLGLTAADTNYGFTTLNPTGFASTNSQPDWQTPMGQTVVRGITNGPGSVVLDSGISNAFITAPGLSNGITELTVYLMNSGGAVGYRIDTSDPSNQLNPSSIELVAPGTNGIYSQNQPPFEGHYFNSGRNVFIGFDMLYDAENGYMGLRPNSYGAASTNIFFAPQAGGFPNPIPEPGTVALLLAGLAAVLLRQRCSRRSLHRTRRTGGNLARDEGLSGPNPTAKEQAAKTRSSRSRRGLRAGEGRGRGRSSSRGGRFARFGDRADGAAGELLEQVAVGTAVAGGKVSVGRAVAAAGRIDAEVFGLGHFPDFTQSAFGWGRLDGSHGLLGKNGSGSDGEQGEAEERAHGRRFCQGLRDGKSVLTLRLRADWWSP